jgi:putative membrane protein
MAAGDGSYSGGRQEAAMPLRQRLSFSDVQASKPIEIDPRTYLAAERTLLAWFRTALAMMGFGFVVARFGLFLRQLAEIRNVEAPQGRFSLSIGVGLVALGVVTTILAAVRHQRVVRHLTRGEPIGNSRMGLVFAGILACVGFAMAVYLLIAQRGG